MYDKKLKEYKSKQSDLLEQMQEHSKADEAHHLTASRLRIFCLLLDRGYDMRGLQG